MRALVLAALLATCTPAHAGPPPGVGLSCYDPDTVTIHDAGHGMAVVTYYNSAAKCSKDVDLELVSPNGIAARVVIWANPPSAGDAEVLKVFPLNPGMFADPPEVDVEDGETVEVRVMGGLS